MKKTLNVVLTIALLLTFASHASAQWALVETFDVDSLNVPTVTSTTVLDSGRWYRFEVSGTYYAGDDITADAEYSSRFNLLNWQDEVEGYESFGEGLLELKVNNVFVEWGDYNPSHVYTMDFIGEGTTVDFQIYDTYGINNAGVLTVEIYTLATIDKTMQSEAGLGDHVTITLQVDNPYDPNITVEDILPDGLKYITDTLTDNNDLVTPVITDDGIALEVNHGAHTITFDVQVVQVSDVNEISINEAVVYNDTGGVDANDIAEIILRPYEGFSKVVVDFNNLGDYGNPADVNDIHVPMGNDVHWWISILVQNIAGDAIVDMNDIIVSDRLGGDLESDSYEVSQGDVSLFDFTRNGKRKGGNTDKQHITWTIGHVTDANEVELILEISTDLNTAHRKGEKGARHQEYTSEGWHALNSGAVLKFIDPITGFQLSAHTPEIWVWAFPTD